MSAPILSPSFKWISSATHDAGSDAFRERQLARIKAADDARRANGAEADRKVRTINRKGNK